MPHVTVTIAGHTYRMACGEGEERRLEALAALYDGRIGEMRSAFGEIGDLRLHVMAALAIADDLQEARRRIGALEAEAQPPVAGGLPAEAEERVAQAVARAAERLESLARGLNAPSGAKGE
jgi:cell division protein ZapA